MPVFGDGSSALGGGIEISVAGDGVRGGGTGISGVQMLLMR